MSTDLAQRLGDLADAAHLPTGDPAYDLARGRRRRRGRRLAGAGLAAVVLLGGGGVGVALTAGDEASRGVDAPAASGPASPSATPSEPAPPATDAYDARELLRFYRDIVASYLDPQDRYLERRVTGFQSGGSRGGVSLGTKLGWSEGGEGLALVQISVSTTLGAQGVWACDRQTRPTCESRVVGGLPVLIGDDIEGHGVGVEHPDGTYVRITTNGLFGNNSLTPVEGFEISDDDLIAAASDERWVAPTEEQVDTANDAFGFPDFP